YRDGVYGVASSSRSSISPTRSPCRARVTRLTPFHSSSSGTRPRRPPSLRGRATSAGRRTRSCRPSLRLRRALGEPVRLAHRVPLLNAILLAHGPLRERVSAALTGFVYSNGGVIVAHDQYVDQERQRYFTRLEWRLDGFKIPRGDLADRLDEALRPFELRSVLFFSDVVPRIADRILNVHHAFLPAFPGAKPYHAAYRRGVKIIGATSHYVTADLDAGPIVEQDVIRVSHATPVDEMIRLGRDLEKVVLARAVWMHLQRRVIVDEGRTVIFQ